MRYIFPDSNIFYNNWHLSSADFSLLLDTIKDSQSILLISEVVCCEVQNKYHEEQNLLLADLKKNFEKAQRFNISRTDFDFEILKQPYNFKAVLNEKVEFVEFIDCEMVPHSLVIDRAVNRKMPFRANEKGYRDTMIWLSMLNYLKEKPASDEVYFVTQNRDDFFSAKGMQFHEDLLEDLEKQGIHCQIFPYSSLNDFINAKVKTDEFRFSDANLKALISQSIESEIEWELVFELDTKSVADFKKMLDASGIHFRFLANLLNHKFEIIEGIEDGKVLKYKRITADAIYFEYQFNLRRCGIEFTIPVIDYLEHKSGIELFYHSTDAEDANAHLIYYCRPEFTVSFVSHFEGESVSGFQILKMGFIQ